MSEKTVGITPEQLQELLSTVLKEAKALNPIEQKKLDDDLKASKRKGMIMASLGYAEDLKRWNQQNGCTHSRYPMSAGKLAGYNCAKGQGEWTTGGQVHGDDTVSLVCGRCGTTWRWKASPQERDYAMNEGLMGFPPPPIEQCINKADFLRKMPVAPELEKVE